MKKLSLLCATTALVMPVTAFAQSTGSQDFENEETIVITGTRSQEVGGITAPDTTKAKAALTSEVIQRQNPGQTILDTVNLIPGVSFQNNDAYGSSGGTLNIRGFSADRISLTVDGIPLNDSGNYAIFSNQQFDPEIIGEVNVNLGTTDVDSPTASAAGGTVNYRTIVPRQEMGALVSASIGEYDFHRLFGLFETGNLTSFGTRAFVSASYASNDNPFNNYGKVYKQQYNAKIYQPIGNKGDFVAIAGHYNPSNTGNIRVSSRFTFGKFTLTVDPSYQYVKANGGGTTTGDEGLFDINPNPLGAGGVANRANCRTTPNGPNVTCVAGYLGGTPFFGRDINGDGDTLDRVTVLVPSQTQTHRFVVIAGVRYDIN